MTVVHILLTKKLYSKNFNVFGWISTVVRTYCVLCNVMCPLPHCVQS